MRATFFVVAVSLLLAGCASQSPLPEVTAHKSPVSSTAKVPKTHHHTTLTGYTHRAPLAPDAWATDGEAKNPDAAKTTEECKKTEGASDDCPTQ